MKRLALLLLWAAAVSAADPGRDAWELLSSAASALSESDSRSAHFQSYDNSASFLSNFDHKTPGYEQIAQDVAALLREAQVASSIDLVSNEGDAACRELVVDWTLEITPQREGPATASTRRKQRVKIRVEKRKKGWAITAFEPRDFFSAQESGK
jgi:hypothetical protein